MTLQQLFKNSGDIKFQPYIFGQKKVYFITCEAMIEQQLLYEVVLPRVKNLYNRIHEESFEKIVEDQLHIPELKKVEPEEEDILIVYQGYLLLYFEDEGLLYSCNIAKKPNRTPDETRLEVTVKGPRDNFIEDISVNIALIRKRLPTNSLCVEKFEVGRRSKTAVAILYFDDIADKNILNEMKQRLEQIDIDIIFSGDVLFEQIYNPTRVFPRTYDTGRPDFAVQSLVRGRFLIMVDGVAYATITPVNLFFLLKTEEDSEYPLGFSSLERITRIFGISIGALLPAFWLALTTYHQNQLPFQLLATVVQVNTGVPFPSSLEMLVMLFMFELFREAGLRLPSVIGGTIGVVGGLIIGDAAIRSGITSAAMVVIIATSTIATYTLVNQSLVATVSILRVCFILMSAFFGLFGFFVTFFFTMVFASNLRTYGVPYMNIGADIKWSTISKALFRVPQKKLSERPEMLNPQDKARSKEVGK